MWLVLSMRATVSWCSLYHGGDVACHANVVVVIEPPVCVAVNVLGLHVV